MTFNRLFGVDVGITGNHTSGTCAQAPTNKEVDGGGWWWFVVGSGTKFLGLEESKEWGSMGCGWMMDVCMMDGWTAGWMDAGWMDGLWVDGGWMRGGWMRDGWMMDG